MDRITKIKLGGSTKAKVPMVDLRIPKGFTLTPSIKPKNLKQSDKCKKKVMGRIYSCVSGNGYCDKCFDKYYGVEVLQEKLDVRK